MLQRKHQSFKDGMARFYTVSSVDNKDSLTYLRTLRYENRTVGFNRFYTALQANVKFDCLIRFPSNQGVTAEEIVILNDGKQYDIIQIQYPEDISPPVMDYTLRKRKTEYDIGG